MFCSVVCFHAPLFALGHFGGAFWGSPNLEGSRILDDAKMMSQRPFFAYFLKFGNQSTELLAFCFVHFFNFWVLTRAMIWVKFRVATSLWGGPKKVSFCFPSQ